MKPHGAADKKSLPTKSSTTSNNLASKNAPVLKNEKIHSKAATNFSHSKASTDYSHSKVSTDYSHSKAGGPKIQYRQTQEVPEPIHVAQQAIMHWPYYHNKKNNKVYFYGITSIDGDCRYTEFKQEPAMTKQFIAQLRQCYSQEPIYVVPAEIAFKKLQEFKKEGKYQQILSFNSQQFKNLNKAW